MVSCCGPKRRTSFARPLVRIVILAAVGPVLSAERISSSIRKLAFVIVTPPSVFRTKTRRDSTPKSAPRNIRTEKKTPRGTACWCSVEVQSALPLSRLQKGTAINQHPRGNRAASTRAGSLSGISLVPLVREGLVSIPTLTDRASQRHHRGDGVARVEAHHADALGRAGERGDFFDAGADDLPFFRNDDELFALEIAGDKPGADDLSGLRCYCCGLDARAAAALHLVFGHLGALAVAL